MENITIYNCLKITSTMSGCTAYLLCDDIAKLEALRTIFDALIHTDDNGEGLGAFIEYVYRDGSVVYIDENTDWNVDIVGMLKGTDLHAITSDGDVYLFRNMIEYSEHF